MNNSFNPAAPQPDGTWQYSEPVQSTSKATLDPPPHTTLDPRTAPAAYDEVEDGELPHEETVEADSRGWSPAPVEPIPILRLVVNSSTILPPTQKVVMVDAAHALTIGRDRSFDKLVRLKELAVSKTHASLFWAPSPDGPYADGGHWAVTDYGSTQGTWVSRGGAKEFRLSEAKVASAPFALEHDDTLRIGTTTFTVHIHPSLACSACALAPDSSNLVLLTEPAATATPAIGLRTHTPTREERTTAVRTKMRDLKQQILKPNAPAAPTAPAARPKFVDRAAARRARNGPDGTPAPAPGAGAGAAPAVASGAAPAPSPFFTVPGAKPGSVAAAGTTNIRSAPAAGPFDPTSRGALLLSKLSKPATPAPSSTADSAPITSSGDDAASQFLDGLGKLIEARTFGQVGREERPGLGSRPMSTVGAETGGAEAALGAAGGQEKRGWREDVRELNRKRFREMEAS